MHFNPKHIPLIGFWLCALSMPVFAQDNTAGKLHQRANASMCANCHGTEGQTVKDSSVPSIAGLPRDYLCLLYTSPSPRDGLLSRMPSSA